MRRNGTAAAVIRWGYGGAMGVLRCGSYNPLKLQDLRGGKIAVSKAEVEAGIPGFEVQVS